MGNSCIDLSLSNIWQSWFAFSKGKRKTKELDYFSYYLEQNLTKLHFDLNTEQYKHDGYKIFIVNDNKRREIKVANIKDRVIHRLLYEYLYKIYDKTFIYDVWSFRKDKGLSGAIERTQKFLNKYQQSCVWRADIKKFFDNINQKILLEILSLRIKDVKAINVLQKVVINFSMHKYNRNGKHFAYRGIPIGNLISQIFANIYLNELDRFVKHTIKPQVYLRYGDDFIIISKDLDNLKQIREKTIIFLQKELALEINIKNDIIIKTRWGVKFLGVWIYPKGRRLNKRNLRRVRAKLDNKNISSYSGLIKQHSKEKIIKEFDWRVLEKLNEI